MRDIGISRFSHIETPFYFYDMDILHRTLQLVKDEAEKHNFHIHYAVKANANTKLMTTISRYGFGADCVSGNEISHALSCGIEANKVVYAGVGKSDKEIVAALKAGIFCFNCESIPEIELINELAVKYDKMAKIAIRINPNVNANTHHYITTGIEENKFGISRWEFEAVIELLQRSSHVELIGFHFHIGSQITDLSVFKGLCLRINEIKKWFGRQNISVEHINVGGGFGVDYEEPTEHAIPDFASYFEVFAQFLELDREQQVHFELGRSIVAQCGSLISRVLYVKNGIKTKFVILDAGMTELLRPALYQAYHKIENLSSEEKPDYYDVVGPICESSDYFGKSVKLPKTKRNDFIAVRSVGAYGEAMSSRYNLRNIALSYFSDEL